MVSQMVNQMTWSCVRQILVWLKVHVYGFFCLLFMTDCHGLGLWLEKFVLLLGSHSKSLSSLMQSHYVYLHWKSLHQAMGESRLVRYIR